MRIFAKQHFHSSMSPAKPHKLDTDYICVGWLKHIDWLGYHYYPDQASVKCSVRLASLFLIFSIAEKHRLNSAMATDDVDESCDTVVARAVLRVQDGCCHWSLSLQTPSAPATPTNSSL